MTRTEIVFDDVFADLASKPAACLLLEPKMNTAVDASIIDVLGDVVEGRVVEDDVGQRRVRESDRVTTRAKQQLGDLARGAASRRVR